MNLAMSPGLKENSLMALQEVVLEVVVLCHGMTVEEVAEEVIVVVGIQVMLT